MKDPLGPKFSFSSVLSVDYSFSEFFFLIPFCLPEILLPLLVTGTTPGMLLVDPLLKQGGVVYPALSSIHTGLPSFPWNSIKEVPTL